MKELSIEEKAEAYDKAIKEAAIAHKDEDKHLKATLERIFPELKESEDERIRKDIKQHFLYLDDSFPDKAKWLAWLEKQGEQKRVEQCADYYNEGRDLKMPRLSEFENELANILFDREYDGSTETEDDIQRGKLQYELAAIKLAPSLLSLVNSKRWSEEDEMIALSIEQVMNCASLLNIVPEKIDKIRTWLKSLKDRYTWKPSEEQMERLKGIIISLPHQEVLYSLYQDLKKLREE